MERNDFTLERENMQIIERKIGQNRGRARVWLEGKFLTAAGWTRGTRYDVCTTAGQIVLSRSPNGARKVCGKTGKHPIIDVCNQQLAEILAPSGRVIVDVLYDHIVITLKQEAGEIRVSA